VEEGAGAASYAPPEGFAGDADADAACSGGADAAGCSYGFASNPSPPEPPVAWTLGSSNGFGSPLSSKGFSEPDIVAFSNSPSRRRSSERADESEGARGGGRPVGRDAPLEDTRTTRSVVRAGVRRELEGGEERDRRAISAESTQDDQVNERTIIS
jgi:hypothetical protein